MFVSGLKRRYESTGQYASGLFLILFTNECAPRDKHGRRQIRALVRKVALRQTGHFMMGAVTLPRANSVGLCRERFSLSGTYGGDGSPVEVTEYKRRNAPLKPDTFESGEECAAYYDALAKIPFENVERAPGLWDRLHPVPDALATKFWTSEGHAMYAWAQENLDTLRYLR